MRLGKVYSLFHWTLICYRTPAGELLNASIIDNSGRAFITDLKFASHRRTSSKMIIVDSCQMEYWFLWTFFTVCTLSTFGTLFRSHAWSALVTRKKVYCRQIWLYYDKGNKRMIEAICIRLDFLFGWAIVRLHNRQTLKSILSNWHCYVVCDCCCSIAQSCIKTFFDIKISSSRLPTFCIWITHSITIHPICYECGTSHDLRTIYFLNR